MTLSKEMLESRWSEMIDTLNRTDGAVINHAEKRPGLSEQQIRDQCKETGFEATDDIIAFYSWANGVRLQWSLNNYEYVFGGSIDIIPLEEIRDPEAWLCGPDALEYPLESYGYEFDEAEGNVFPFDFFQRTADDVEIAAFLPNRGDLDVIVSEDNVACIEDAALLSFGEYIELILRTYGSSMARGALCLGATNDEAIRAADAFGDILSKPIDLAALMEITRSEPNIQESADCFR